jgi:hypothetical protein
LWEPKSGTASPGYEPRFLTGCRDGGYFDRIEGEEPESAPAADGDAIDGGAVWDAEYNEEDMVAKPREGVTLLPVELRSSMWIRNEVAGIEDEEARRLVSLAFL